MEGMVNFLNNSEASTCDLKSVNMLVFTYGILMEG